MAQVASPSSFLRELQSIIACSDFNLITGLELAFEQFHGKRVQQLFPPSPGYGGQACTAL